MYKNDIPLFRRLFHGRDYPCSVGLIDLLRIRACQRVHVVKAVGSKFVSFINLKNRFTENALACDELQNKKMT